MDLTDLATLKTFLSRFHIRLSEKLGQNFLINAEVLRQIVETADLCPSDTVLEIGAGIGTLTQALAKTAGKVLAVEKDRRLLSPLRFALKEFANVEIVNQDILKLNIPQLLATHLSLPASHFQLPTNFKVVANIPYYITGQILKILLALSQKPEAIILMVQKEVGARICARPGQMSVLALSVQFYGLPKIMANVPKNAFYPQPAVDSVILKIKPYREPFLKVSEDDFFRLVKIGFSGRRKTLENNLSSGFHISKKFAAEVIHKARLAPAVRAQELSLQQWETLLQILQAYS